MLVQRISKGGSRRRSKGAVKVQNKQSNEESLGVCFCPQLAQTLGGQARCFEGLRVYSDLILLQDPVL